LDRRAVTVTSTCFCLSFDQACLKKVFKNFAREISVTERELQHGQNLKE